MNEEYQVIGMALRNVEALRFAVHNVAMDYFKGAENQMIFIKIMNDFSRHGMTSLQAMLTNAESERERIVLRSSYEGTSHGDMQTFERAVVALKRKRMLREINNISKMMDQATRQNENPEDIIEQTFEKLWMIDEKSEGERPIISAEVGAAEFLEAFEHREKNPDDLLGLPLHYEDERGRKRGLPFVYDYMQGLRGGDLIIIAGKTGTGKTGLGMNITRIVSVELGKRPYYLNAEMDNVQMYDRLVAATAGVPHLEVATSKLSGSPSDKKLKREAITNAVNKISQSKLITSEIPTITPSRIAQLAKQVKNTYEGGVDVVIVDYLGRLDSESNSRSMQTWDELYQNAKHLKEMARKLNVPVIVLAQLNDEGKIEGAKKIANEADGVWFWEKIEPKDSAQQKRLHDAGLEPKDANFTLQIKKNRRGPGEGQYIHFDYVKTHQVIDQVDHTGVK